MQSHPSDESACDAATRPVARVRPPSVADKLAGAVEWSAAATLALALRSYLWPLRNQAKGTSSEVSFPLRVSMEKADGRSGLGDPLQSGWARARVAGEHVEALHHLGCRVGFSFSFVLG